MAVTAIRLGDGRLWIRFVCSRCGCRSVVSGGMQWAIEQHSRTQLTHVCKETKCENDKGGIWNLAKK